MSWKDGTTSYVPLHKMKNSYPLETADFVNNNKLMAEPAFQWWVPHVLQKCDCIVSKIGKKKYWSCTHKYGIELTNDDTVPIGYKHITCHMIFNVVVILVQTSPAILSMIVTMIRL